MEKLKNDSSICVLLPKEMKEAIENYANKKNLSLNAVVRIAISELIQKGI